MNTDKWIYSTAFGGETMSRDHHSKKLGILSISFGLTFGMGYLHL